MLDQVGHLGHQPEESDKKATVPHQEKQTSENRVAHQSVFL